MHCAVCAESPHELPTSHFYMGELYCSTLVIIIEISSSTFPIYCWLKKKKHPRRKTLPCVFFPKKFVLENVVWFNLKWAWSTENFSRSYRTPLSKFLDLPLLAHSSWSNKISCIVKQQVQVFTPKKCLDLRPSEISFWCHLKVK